MLIIHFGIFISVFIILIESYDEKSDFFPEKTKEESILYNPVKKVAAFVYPSIEKWYEEFKDNHAKDSEAKQETIKEE